MFSAKNPINWASNLIENMDDGTYWHIPASDCILRIDKSKNRFVLIRGQMTDNQSEYLKMILSDVGYHIITREEERPL